MNRLLLIGFILLAAPVGAEELTLFQASSAGEAAWMGAGACVRPTVTGGLSIRECDRRESFGNAYVKNRLPYFADGRIRMETKRVTAADYSLQVLYFKEGEHYDTRDLLSKVQDLGSMEFVLGEAAGPEDADSIVLKIWVAGVQRGGIELGELEYTVACDPTRVRLDEAFDQRDRWTSNGARFLTSPDGATIALEDHAEAGSLLYDRRIEKIDSDMLMLDVANVKRGAVTVQAVAFDEIGTYLYSFDALRGLGNGFHCVKLSDLPWPEHADSYAIKIWVSGEQDATAVLRRMLVLKQDENR